MLTGDRGSVLMLVPAGVLVVLVLAALTVDLSLVHLARREVVAGAEAAANDAVTAGLDEAAFRAGRGYRLDHTRVGAVVQAALAGRGLLDRLERPPRIEISGTTVSVSVTLRVDYVFARALPGATNSTVVSATGTATPVSR